MLRLDGIQIRQSDFALSADFEVSPGSRNAVIGPSGSGKSTLLAAISGFLRPALGRITWAKTDITDTAPGARPIAMLFQDNNLFPHLTVQQNIGLGLRPNLRLSDPDHARIDAAIQRVGLAGMATRKPSELSGGQQSRAALARVLVQDKPLILLDEPFAALGPALRQDMLSLVRALTLESGASLLMVTHAPEDVARVADAVIFVEGGRAHAPEPAEALMKNPPPALRAYLGG